MSERGSGPGGEERIAELEAKLAELRRVNAALGQELRRGAASRQPRSGLAASRALAKLTNERDRALAELEEARAQLAASEAGFDGLRNSFDGLRNSFAGLQLERDRLREEAERLRGGGSGLLRRARARLRRR